MMRPEMGSPNKKPHASSSTVISLLHSEGMSDNTTGGNHTPTVVTHDAVDLAPIALTLHWFAPILLTDVMIGWVNWERMTWNMTKNMHLKFLISD